MSVTLTGDWERLDEALKTLPERTQKTKVRQGLARAAKPLLTEMRSIYRNAFNRAGRKLAKDIVIERGRDAQGNLAVRAGFTQFKKRHPLAVIFEKGTKDRVQAGGRKTGKIQAVDAIMKAWRRKSDIVQRKALLEIQKVVINHFKRKLRK